jgi:uncharacterized membrane protein YphA (DoxX/SURF4 family)
MSYAALVVRLTLAAVFIVAGTAKLADLRSSRTTVAAFGVPEPLARYSGTLLPVAELLTASALLLTASARWGGVSGAVLLALFSGGVAYALSQGRTPDCNCFGQLSSQRISRRTLVRNGVLLLLCVFVVARGSGASLMSWTTNRHAADLTAALAVMAAGVLIVEALNFRVRARALSTGSGAAPSATQAPSLRVGDLAPGFELPDLDGDLVSLEALHGRGLPVVLVFSSPACGPCRQLLPQLARWNVALHESITLVLIESTAGNIDATVAHVREAGELEALLEPDQVVGSSYRIAVTPTAVVVGTDGRVASPPASGPQAIERLIRETVQRDAIAQPAAG